MAPCTSTSSPVPLFRPTRPDSSKQAGPAFTVLHPRRLRASAPVLRRVSPAPPTGEGAPPGSGSTPAAPGACGYPQAEGTQSVAPGGWDEAIVMSPAFFELQDSPLPALPAYPVLSEGS